MVEALVTGRVGVDLYPEQLERPLEEVETYRRYAGGFAANVATGLARLGVSAAVFSAVGDDGHGRFLRGFLDGEGIDCTWLGIHPTLRTALAFCEIWRPDRFPITFYRTPTCPDWEVRPDDIDLELVSAVPLLYLSGTALAREPSRTTMVALAEARGREGTTTILDLDWRPSLWGSAAEYASELRRVLPAATTILGGHAEWAAAGLDPGGNRSATCVVKHGAEGVTVHGRDGGTRSEPGRAVSVVNGLGAGDAFAAGWGYGLLRGRDPASVANAAGAIVAGRHSCSTAMPRLEELESCLSGEEYARSGGSPG
jgi:5-dehydro-2-deoxygluconokinase